jgi:hypothetical protein
MNLQAETEQRPPSILVADNDPHIVELVASSSSQSSRTSVIGRSTSGGVFVPWSTSPFGATRFGARCDDAGWGSSRRVPPGGASSVASAARRRSHAFPVIVPA